MDARRTEQTRIRPARIRASLGKALALGFGALVWLLPARAETVDRRSTEILRYACGSEFGRREITLFANGTVRLREGPWDDQKLYLDELSPEALEDNLRLLRNVDADRGSDRIREPVERGPGGHWIERCEVRLDLPEFSKPVDYELSAFDIPPLGVARIIQIAEELAQYVRPAEKAPAGIPADYEPQYGDVLTTAEGYRYEVLRLTSDERGVELQGLDQPLRIYVAKTEISEAFVSLERDENHHEFWWKH